MTDAPHPAIEIEVNRRAHAVEAAPDTPLLYVLRNELRLNSPKYGCGLAKCGSCTVLRDGVAIRSCAVPVSEVAGSSITTLEGLGTPGQLHPLQQAFLDEQAAQCGYCTAGMIVAAAALLADNPRPTDREIRTALDDVLCRCGSHLRILRAVHRAADRLDGGAS